MRTAIEMRIDRERADGVEVGDLVDSVTVAVIEPPCRSDSLGRTAEHVAGIPRIAL